MMFSQPMDRGHAQFEFSRHEMLEILDAIDNVEVSLRFSRSLNEFRAMLRAMLGESETQQSVPSPHEPEWCDPDFPPE